MNLHVSRPVKTLNLSKSRHVDNVITANLKDQGVRSRLVQILLELRTTYNQIGGQLNVVREALILKYPSALAQYRSKDAKDKALNFGLFSDILEYMKEIESVDENIELIIDDIDHASFTLKRHTELMIFNSERMNRERTI